MPKRIQFEGVTHEFPDDFTDDDIRSALEQQPPQKQQPAPKDERRGFAQSAWDASIGGMLDVGKQVLNKGVVKVADEIGTAVKDRYVANLNKTNNPFARALDAVGGPVVDFVADDVKQGNYYGAAGTLYGTVATLGMGKLLNLGAKAAEPVVSRARTVAKQAVKQPAATLESMLPQNGGTMQNAVKYADSKGWMTTVGERTGSPMLQTAERVAEMTPGASGVATDAYMARNAEIMSEGARLRKSVGKAYTVPNETNSIQIDKTAAADAVLDRINGRTESLKEIKNKRYESVESAVERNRAKLQAEADAKWQAETRQIKLENANTLQKWIQENIRRGKGGYKQQLPEPVIKELPTKPEIIGAEVSLQPIQNKLRGLYDELSRNMPETQRAASPGYAILKAIVEDTKKSVSAISLDKDLSTIKSVLRNEQKEYAATPSGRYAAATIDAIEGEMQSAIERAGGKPAVENLLKARRTVKNMHSTLEALEQILPKADGPAANSPAVLFDRLTAQGDTRLNQLIEIKKRAPRAIDDIAATYLEGGLQKVTGEAGKADLAAAKKAWDRLGPRTKAELYGDKLPELNAFWANAPELIKNVNKSGSGFAMQAGKVLNAGSLLIGGLAGAYGGLGGVVEGMTAAGAGMASANAMAKFLFRKGNATLLQDAMRYPPESSAGKLALKRLNAVAEKDPAISALLASQNGGGSQKRP